MKLGLLHRLEPPLHLFRDGLGLRIDDRLQLDDGLSAFFRIGAGEIGVDGVLGSLLVVRGLLRRRGGACACTAAMPMSSAGIRSPFMSVAATQTTARRLRAEADFAIAWALVMNVKEQFSQ
ncbi:MAG: hypothetical protein QM770_02235 [Tepidisphaeraceae bacterium]